MSKDNDKMFVAEQYHQQGEAAAQEGDYEKAEYLLKEAIILYPQDEKNDAQISLAVTYNQWGKINDSIQTLESLIFNTSSRKFYWLGINYHSIKEYGKAISCFKKCIEIDGNDASLLEALLESLKSSGNMDEATLISDKLYKLNPSYFKEDLKSDVTSVDKIYIPLKMKGEYNGNYKNEKKNGYGSIDFGGGRKYIGEFENDEYSGIGTFIFENGEKYVGEFKNGIYEGKGTLYFANGNSYIGEFSRGKRHGIGTYKNLNVFTYIGDHNNDLMHGVGKFIYSETEYYEGQIRYNKIDGKGLYKYQNGNIYEGEFKSSKRNGIGKMSFANGNIYEGNFKENKFNGVGKLKFKSGDIYEGEFEDDRMHGKGKYTFKNGNIWEGVFCDGKQDGEGILYMASGKKYIANYLNNQCMELKMISNQQ